MDETYIKIKGVQHYLYRAFDKEIKIRQINYLNNIFEQDHRGIKRITKPMMGFKAFHSAEATLSGIELCRILKRQVY